MAGGQSLPVGGGQASAPAHFYFHFYFLLLPVCDFTQENSTACHLGNWLSRWQVEMGDPTLSHYKFAFAAGLWVTLPRTES